MAGDIFTQSVRGDFRIEMPHCPFAFVNSFRKLTATNSHISKTCLARVSKQLVGKEPVSPLLPLHQQTKRNQAPPTLVRDVCLLQTSQPILMAYQKMEHNIWQWL